MAENQAAPGAPSTGEIESVDDPIRIDMDKRVDIVIALIFVIFGAGAIYYATGFRVGGFPDPVTARGLPYVTGTYLVIAGILLIARRVLTWSDIPGNYAVAEGPSDERAEAASTWRPFAIMAMILFWVLTARDPLEIGFSLGFMVNTPLMLFGMLWLMNVREPWRLTLFPILFTLGIWAVFSQILGVRLPLGFLEPVARSWGLIL